MAALRKDARRCAAGGEGPPHQLGRSPPTRLGTRVEPLPQPEWIAFGTKGAARRFWFWFHAPEHAACHDGFDPVEANVTEFGFGRDRTETCMTHAPTRFTVGLRDAVETDLAREIAARGSRARLMTNDSSHTVYDFLSERFSVGTLEEPMDAAVRTPRVRDARSEHSVDGVAMSPHRAIRPEVRARMRDARPAVARSEFRTGQAPRPMHCRSPDQDPAAIATI